MDYGVKFSRLAIKDLREICDWYEEQSVGLSERFLEELQKVVDQIAQNPHCFIEKAPNCRMARLRTFPYKIFYMVNDSQQKTRVIAVAHRARHPRIWQKRL